MTQKGPDILVFPPLASVIAPLAAVALEWLLPLKVLPPFVVGPTLWLGLAVMLAAGVLAATGARTFRRSGTNVDPRKPALRLVETGPFRVTRNPMYLGMVLLQLGLALAFSLDWAIPGAAVLWAVLHWGVVLREESYLVGRFGLPYREYLDRTRRWL